jgi:hypothetical protein
MPPGKCANCDASVSYFARACARCGLPNQPNAVTTVAALALLVVSSAGIFFGARAYLDQRTAQQQDTTSPQTADSPQGDYGWLVQAMADCDVYAKQYADTLYFLIIPLAPSGKRVSGWTPAETGRAGTSASLVSSQDALLGLRNGVFTLYRKPLTFAVKDGATQTVFKWKPTNGVSELKSRESAIEQLTLGFQIGENAEVDWGPSFTTVKGTCYWIIPVIGADANTFSQHAPAQP